MVASILATVVLAALSGCSGSSEYAAQYKALSPTYTQDRAQAIVRCVAEAGFTVHTNEGGGVGYSSNEVPDAQADLADQAIKTCYTSLQGAEAPLTTTQWTTIYHLQVEARGCLASQGYDTSEPPTLQTFLGSTQGSPWSPWSEMNRYRLPQAKVAELTVKCPDPLVYAAEFK
ncbi:hypothetical protein JT358_13370 [Micrococcales bacterium 31B]|nr:hypothetical protein [Micrococcales bacterium 31B]